MNTLSTNSILENLNAWKDYKDNINSVIDKSVSGAVNVMGVHGAFHSYFLQAFANACYNKFISSFKYSSAGYNAQSIKEKICISSHCSDSLVIVPTDKDGEKLKIDLNTVFPEADVYFMPGWGTLSYRPVGVGSRIFGQRAGFLSAMVHSMEEKSSRNSLEFEPKVFILSTKTAQTPMPSPDSIKSRIFTLCVGQTFDTVEIAGKLNELGYLRVPKVGLPGEFSLRGEVLDVFLPNDELPVRILFDFDQIEKIRTFDPDDQTTISQLESILVYPMKEVIWDEHLISKISELLSDKNFEDGPAIAYTDDAKFWREKFIEELTNNGNSEGEELFYPALWDKEYTILDYVHKDSCVMFFDFDRIENAQESMKREMHGMFRQMLPKIPVLLPEKLLIDFDQILGKSNRCVKFRSISTETEQDHSSCESTVTFSCDPSQSYFGNINYLKENLSELQKEGWKVFVFADNENQAVRITEILKELTTVEKGFYPLTVIGKVISEGFILPDIKLRVIQENEIFGRKKFVPKSLRRSKSQVIDSFVELNPGDYVVHVNYGIGKFLGIERVKALGNERDYIKLEYANQDYVFVPIEQVNLVQRYIGSEGEAPRMDVLGSKAWENRKNKVKKAVEDLAGKLIELYSRRKASHGFPFPKDTEWQATFEAAFPYEDTPDQITVTEEIKKDMEKPVPMDRLVCGDVGYGKTEIAMRAAFKAVMGGKQVAFLAPTTILAEQHYETCIERFRNFPVKIAQLSRFVTPAEQKKVLKEIAEGQIDILVGTHRIIQKDVVFKNLGLMIIDEEQRFGVKDKEKLKVLKNNIDSLAMSATPIPRTLHMSLLKIRDMSLLTTPPQTRQPVETVIDPYSDDRVVKAIRKEVERGGQVFYLHNRVESLNETRLKLEKLLPEMMIDVAHGQMTSDQLDDIFRRFKMGGFHVLVATTIIENGIDIPNVNTIIIDRADMYGVSQLYQLRGRVGRSDRKAYAYLLYPGNKSLSEIAMKRLNVISDFTELGSGFKIAMKDMEIRGAGNLLGKDQSGNVYSVGFDMYVRLLNDAVNRLVLQEDYKEQQEVLLELEYTGFIPDSYVNNPQTKMEIYKKIAAVTLRSELDAVYNELEDRFGPAPDEVLSLLALSEIRILCRKLNISGIKENKGTVSVTFAKVSDINVNKVLQLIRESAGAVRLDSTKANMLFLKVGQIGLKEKSEFIREKLEKIS